MEIEAWRTKSATAALALVALLAAVLAAAPHADAAKCRQPKGKWEPPCNPALAQSPWSGSHRSSYAQASSPYRGIESRDVRAQHIDLPGIPISIQFSGRYDDGGRVAWGSLIDGANAGRLFKVDAESGKVIDVYTPAERESEPPPTTGAAGITGAYNLLDRSNRFIVPRLTWFDVYADARRGDAHSPIELRKRFVLPGSALCGSDDKLVGAVMTYDGYIAFATENGVVGTIPRQPTRMKRANLRTVSLNGDAACAAADEPETDLQTVSNNIAADENGGIYIVTSKRMVRVNHDPRSGGLALAWSAPYNAGSEVSEIRLGQGSGSTPTLMGTGRGQDKFVVITDGQDLMHQDLFWRNGIPKDWQGLGGDRPRRMACEHPVTFGDPDAEVSLSEQSVAVRGYATFNVNNLLDYDFPDGLPAVLLNALAALRGGDPAATPHGAERIDWNPRTRRCRSVWANPRVSIPNGIPSISERSGLAYGIRLEHGEWGVGGLDWRTGRSEFFAPSPGGPCSDTAIGYLEQSGTLPILGPVIEELPNSCENSFYAATEIGPKRSIWTGTFLGLTRYVQRR
ncbi:MAG: hypothetical protein BroJett022_13430 [Actinomycetes bacterium]|nr:MAG: hypothetical protein BroJett022_13430 [Actinomycetes bacterium]